MDGVGWRAYRTAKRPTSARPRKGSRQTRKVQIQSRNRNRALRDKGLL